MGKIKLPDFPELPEIPQIDEEDVGRRVGNVAEKIGMKAGKRVGSAVGGFTSLWIGVVNDVLDLPRELLKK